jgi:hypothetical protein
MSSCVEPIRKVPPSIKTNPGPVGCSCSGDTSKPPFSGLLYSQPVVRDESFLLKNEQEVKEKVKITNNVR